MTSRRRLPILVMALAFAVGGAASPASAQPVSPWTYTFEVFGNVGYGRLVSGDNEWGKGGDYGFAVGLRPLAGGLQGLGFEVQASWLAGSHAAGSQASNEVNANLFAANVLYHFRGRTRVQPYIVGGLGVLHVNYTQRCVDCVFDWDPATGEWVSRGVSEWQERGTKAGFTFGGGAKIAIQRHLSIRPEFLLTDTTAGSGYNWGLLQWRVGVGVHF